MYTCNIYKTVHQLYFNLKTNKNLPGRRFSHQSGSWLQFHPTIITTNFNTESSSVYRRFQSFQITVTELLIYTEHEWKQTGKQSLWAETRWITGILVPLENAGGGVCKGTMDSWTVSQLNTSFDLSCQHWIHLKMTIKDFSSVFVFVFCNGSWLL